MKGKLLKKIVAAVATIAMAAQFAAVIPASAAETIPNVEVTPSAATYVVKSDAEKNTSHAEANPLWTGYNKITGGHAGFANENWGVNNVALIKFDITGKVGEDYAIKKVTLSYSGTATSARGASHVIGSTIKGWGADVTYDGIGGVNTIAFEQIGDAHSITKGNTETVSQDVTEYAKSQSDNILAFAVLDLMAGGTTIDKSSIKLTIERFDPNAEYTVTYISEGEQLGEEIVEKNAYPTSVPADPAKLGYVFDGWKVGDTSEVLTKAQVEARAFNALTTLTAQFSIDPTYKQKIAKVEFTTGETVINAPSDGSASKDLTVKVTSENGKDLTDDCSYTWSIVGNEADAEYTSLSKNDSKTNTLSVLNGMEKSYFGYVKVVATYTPSNGTSEDATTGEAKSAYALLQDSASSNFIPAQGYPVSFNDYADSLIGYQATELGYQNPDTVFGWSEYGGNGSRTLTLKKGDDGDKYFEFAANGGGSSTNGVYQWVSQRTKPYIVETVIKLPVGQDYGLYNNTPNNSAGSSFAYGWQAVMKSGGLEIRNNDDTTANSTIEGVSGDEWYKVVTIADYTTKKYYVKVYNPDTNALIGESDIVGLGTGDSRFCVHGDGTIGMKSMRAYNPTLSSASIIGASTVKVPETGEAATKTTYKATVKDTNDNVIPTGVTWSLASTYNGVEINETTGELSVSNGAGGNITIVATAGAARAEYPVLLTTSSNVVTISGSSSITIPFSGMSSAVETYSAKTLDKDGNDVAGDSITYSLLQKDGITPYTTLPNGIAFDARNAKLTVSAGAPAGVVYVQAKNGEGLTNTVKVNIHGMLFDFGTDDPDEGYTQVLATTQYSSNTGFGFQTLDGLTAAADSVTGTGEFTFQVKVPNGNYQVEVDTVLPQYQGKNNKGETVTLDGTVYSETVDSSGISKGNGKFNVAVCDEILDLRLTPGATIKSVQIAQLAQPKAGEKPSIYSIGDSTTKNSGHYTGYDANSTTADHRTYASWGNCVTSDMWNKNFLAYSNNGMAGRNAASFYREGRLESVLLSVAPGDYVTINMGINSEGENYDKFMEYYYVLGVLERGAIPVILTHTPNGPGLSGGGTFDTSFHVTRNVATLRTIAAKYDLPLIEVDKHFEEYFNSLLEKDFDTEVFPLRNSENENGRKEGYTAPTTVLGVVQTWFNDHNHYTRELGTPIATYIMSQLNEIIENPFAITSIAKTAAASGDDVVVSLTATKKENCGTGSKTYDAYVAQYDASGNLVDVQKADVTFSTSTLTDSVTYTPVAGATAKLFIWDGMTPVLTDTAITVA